MWQNFWLVAAETAEATEGGSPFDFIKENNLLNFAVVLAALIYVGSGFLKKLLGERRQTIEQEIQEVETRKTQAEQELNRQKQSLANAATEAAQIRARAQENAKRVSEQVLAQVEQEIARLRQDAQKDLDSERERVVAQLRRLTLEQTFQKVETDLPQLIDADKQKALIDQGIALLGVKNAG